MIIQISAYSRIILIAFSFFAMMFLLWKSRQQIAPEFMAVPAKYRWVLLVLTLLPFIFYFASMPPKHVSDDEAYYQVAAKNILTMGHLGDLPKGGGWAFLISLGYLLTGINGVVSLQISQLLGAGSIVGIFFLATWAGLSLRTALIGAALFTFIPARIFWAATAESHTAAIFFVIWATAFSFLLCRKIEKDIFILAVTFWVFAVLIRFETIVLFLFFLMCLRFFISKNEFKKLPFIDALLWTGIIVTPNIILGVNHALTGHWNGEVSNISVNNFFHNSAKYGTAFLVGKIHPILLSIAAILGLGSLLKRDKKIAAVLIGWIVLVSSMYFSIWFQNYGDSSTMFAKTRLFIFFYPPFILCAACGIVWLGEKLAPQYVTRVSALFCTLLIIWSTFYYQNYPSGFDAFILQMAVVKDIPNDVTDDTLIVACFPQVFTGSTALTLSTAPMWRFMEPPMRTAIFKSHRRVYLIDDIVAQRSCKDNMATIKEQGRAVLTKEWINKNTHFGLYSLSPF